MDDALAGPAVASTFNGLRRCGAGWSKTRMHAMRGDTPKSRCAARLGSAGRTRWDSLLLLPDQQQHAAGLV
jgi:hypothetical protein